MPTSTSTLTLSMTLPLAAIGCSNNLDPVLEIAAAATREEAAKRVCTLCRPESAESEERERERDRALCCACAKFTIHTQLPSRSLAELAISAAQRSRRHIYIARTRIINYFIIDVLMWQRRWPTGRAAAAAATALNVACLAKCRPALA